MSTFLESAPNNWHYHLVVASVPKDGSPFTDNFLLSVERPLNYWSQIYTFTAPVKVYIEVSRSDGRLVASISVSGETIIPCSRCLEPAKIVTAGHLKYFFSLKPNKYTKKEEDEVKPKDDQEIIFLDSWENEIDLVPRIWEVLITSLPVTAFCFEGCKGLCPRCGINLNETSCSCEKDDRDPRFDVLRSFVKDKK